MSYVTFSLEVALQWERVTVRQGFTCRPQLDRAEGSSVPSLSRQSNYKNILKILKEINSRKFNLNALKLYSMNSIFNSKPLLYWRTYSSSLTLLNSLSFSIYLKQKILQINGILSTLANPIRWLVYLKLKTVI